MVSRCGIISLLVVCMVKISSQNDSTKKDTDNNSENGLPVWAIAVICVAIVFALLILWFIWAHRNSWCCTCLYGFVGAEAEDNTILPSRQDSGIEYNNTVDCENLKHYPESVSKNVSLHVTIPDSEIVDFFGETILYDDDDIVHSNNGIHSEQEKRFTGFEVLEVLEYQTKRVSKLNDDSNYDDSYCDAEVPVINNVYIEDTEDDSVQSVLRDTQFENLISQAEEWKTKCIREGDTDLRDLCFTATRFIAGLFDGNGGMLRMDHIGIQLLIPPGAIEGAAELIYMYIVMDPQNMPLIENDQARVAPTVFCGPHGMGFLERVVLSYEHCANISDKGTGLLPVFTSSKPNERMLYQNLEEEDDVLVIKRKGKCSIMISHFTGFSSIATSTSPDLPLEIYMSLVVYSSLLQQSSTNWMIIRLYYVHKTTDAMHMVVCEEESLKGIKRTPLTAWLFKTNLEASSLLEIDQNWAFKNPKKTVAAKMLRENSYVTKSYMLSKTANDSVENNIMGSIYVTQPGQSDQFNETLHILAHTNEDNASSPTFMARTSVLLKQPLRHTLKTFLDLQGQADWRMFAHELELDDMIPKLEKESYRSPTYELLNMWESFRSRDDAKDWTNLEEIFEKMGRKDAVTEILKAKSESEYVTLRGGSAVVEPKAACAAR